MTINSPPSNRSQTKADRLAQRQRLDALCDEFEQACQRGETPGVEAFVDRVQGSMRVELRRELTELAAYYGARSAKVEVAQAESAAKLNLADSLRDVAFGYEILRELGRGAMGVVYLARQVRLKRLVALKMILSGGLASLDERARFRREAETAARLQHPNIVQVHDVGEHDGHAYLALEYVGGGNLSQRFDGRPQAPDEAAALVETLARAIQHAHDQGVVHRDLKPANVLLADATGHDSNSTAAAGSSARTVAIAKPPSSNAPRGSSRDAVALAGGAVRVKVADFGLAKLLDHGAAMTQTGAVLGTPSYMAPEAAHGGDVGPAVDIYSLGAILYEALTGRPPFRGATMADTLEQLRNQDPVPPRALQPKTPRDLETICLRCLEKDPRKRFATAADLADDLRRFLNGESITARPVGWFEKTVRWSQRHPSRALAAGTLVAAALLVLSLSLYFNARLSRSLALAEYHRSVAREQSDEIAQQRDQNGKQRDQVARQRDEIERQRDQISIERDEAQRQRREADSQRDAAAKQEQAALFARYSAEMLLADRYLQSQRVSAADVLLRRHQPAASDVDRRFEWYYLWNQCHRADWTLDANVGPVVNAVPSPNGRWIVLCGNDGSIVVWDRIERRDAYTIEPPRETFLNAPRGAAQPSAVFTPDSKTLITCNGDVRLWNVETGKELTPDGTPLQKNGYCIGISITGFTLGVADTDGNLNFWTVHNRNHYRQLKVGAAIIERIVFSPDRRHVAIVQPQGRGAGITIWDLQAPRVVHRIPSRNGYQFLDLAYSSDGKFCATVEASVNRLKLGGQITYRSTQSYSPRWSRELPIEGLTRAAVSRDGEVVWAGSTAGTLRRWYTVNGDELPPLLGHTGAVASMHPLRNEDKLVTASNDRQVKFWDTQLEAEPREWNLPLVRPLDAWALSPSGRRVATYESSRPITIWNVSRQTAEVTLPEALATLRPIEFSADGEHLLVGNDRALELRDVWTGWPARSFEVRSPLLAGQGALSPDGKWLAAIEKGPQRLALWDVETGCQVWRGPAKEQQSITAMQFSADSTLLACGGMDPAAFAEVWLVDSLANSAPTDSRADGSISVAEPRPLSAATPLLRVLLGGNYFRPQSLCFSLDCSELYAGCNSGDVMVIDLTTKHYRRLAKHDTLVRALALDESGRTLFSASADGMVRLTDPRRDQELFVLTNWSPAFLGMQMLNDGRRLVTASASGAITFYSAPDPKPQYARERSAPARKP